MSMRQRSDGSYKAINVPELDYSESISQSFSGFQHSQLSATTKVNHVHYQSNADSHESTLESRTDIKTLSLSGAKSFDLFFVYKHLVEDPLSTVPNDLEKLRISQSCFEALTAQLLLPPAFIFALTRHYLPTGRGFRQLNPQSSSPTLYESWYFLSVRVQTKAQPELAVRDNGAGQMNPFHKLHLPDVGHQNGGLDVLRSCIGIFTRADPVSKKITAVAFDFMHGKWPLVALEPKSRIDEVMKHQKRLGEIETRHFTGALVHLVYLSSAMRWWTNSLNSVNEQLIAYEISLQSELDTAGVTPEATLTKLNRALHSIAAHLHRYLSELKSLQGITTDLISFYESMYSNESILRKEDFDQSRRGFEQVLSQIEASIDFAIELEKKTQNILDLLFNRIQINSDRLLVANGRAMQEILGAMQTDADLGRKMADASHQLALEMKRDSIAMRTIAIITMVFLPGATFAAILAMPFFGGNSWLGKVDRFWIWFVLTVPSTAACFIFYKLWRKTSLRRVGDEERLR